ncbi:hypothetical protein HYO62_10110 [Aerococcaceae bacterium DSM 111022]|nr:hypothetical protein [Aerococcaceae bacterium DSM 111022]MBG9989025.1 hypothetical protein [Aerococcaceae bacterium DSM 111176]
MVSSNDSKNSSVKKQNLSQYTSNVHDSEIANRIEKHDTQKNPKTYSSEELGIDLTTTEWSEDDGWE